MPQYNRPVFESSISYEDSLPWPSVAFRSLGTANVTLMSLSNCSVSTPVDSNLSDCSSAFQSMFAHGEPDLAEYQVFNASSLTYEQQYAIDFEDSVTLNIQVTCKLSHFSRLKRPLKQVLDNSTALNGTAPHWNIYIFDLRMTLDDINDCGMIGSQRIPILSDTALSLTLEHIHDSLGVLLPQPFPSDSVDSIIPLGSECSVGFNLYSATDPPVSAYTGSINSTPLLNASECDLAKDFQRPCLVSATLSFSSQIVRTTESVPGISQLDIWINVGAIVGAVQFFGWILKGSSS